MEKENKDLRKTVFEVSPKDPELLREGLAGYICSAGRQWFTFAKPGETVSLANVDASSDDTSRYSRDFSDSMEIVQASLRRHGTIWFLDTTTLKITAAEADEAPKGKVSLGTIVGHRISKETVGTDLLAIEESDPLVFSVVAKFFVGTANDIPEYLRLVMLKYFPDPEDCLSRMPFMERAFARNIAVKLDGTNMVSAPNGYFVYSADYNGNLFSLEITGSSISTNVISSNGAGFYSVTSSNGNTYSLSTSSVSSYDECNYIVLKDGVIVSLRYLASFILELLRLNGVSSSISRYIYRRKYEVISSTAKLFERLAGHGGKPFFGSRYKIADSVYDLIWLYTNTLKNSELTDFYDSLNPMVLESFSSESKERIKNKSDKSQLYLVDPVSVYLGCRNRSSVSDDTNGGYGNYDIDDEQLEDVIIGNPDDYDRSILVERALGENNGISSILAASAGRLGEYINGHFMSNGSGHEGDLALIDSISRIHFHAGNEIGRRVGRSCAEAILGQFGNDRLNGFVTAIYYGLLGFLTKDERMEFATLSGLDFDYLVGTEAYIAKLCRDRRDSTRGGGGGVRPELKGMPFANLLLCSLMVRSKAIASGEYETRQVAGEKPGYFKKRVDGELVSLLGRICSLISLKGPSEGSGVDPKKIACCASVALHQVASSKVDLDLAFDAARKIFDEVLPWKIKRTLFYGVDTGIASGKYENSQFESAKRTLAEQSNYLFEGSTSECKLPNFMGADMQQLTSRLLDYYPDDSRSLGHELRAQLVSDSIN